MTWVNLLFGLLITLRLFFSSSEPFFVCVAAIPHFILCVEVKAKNSVFEIFMRF